MEKITSTSVLKQIQKQIKNYSEDELIEFLDIVDSKRSKYNNKIQSRLSSAKAAGKTILCVDGSQVFGDDNVLEDMVFIDWVNNILSQNETAEKKIDLYIFDSRCKIQENVDAMIAELKDNGLNETYWNDVNFVPSFIEGSVFVYAKSYIFQGKYPSLETVVEISQR